RCVVAVWLFRQGLDFFFSEAEDGIRYATVTGVQTCALPIYVDRTRLLVQVVHVLSAQQEVTSEILLQLCKREVRRVRLGCRSNPPTHGVELPDEPGIASPSLGRSNLLYDGNSATARPRHGRSGSRFRR